MSDYKPPFQITSAILQLVADICEIVGRWSITDEAISPTLRRENRIRTIHASLAIENNTLSVEQVTAVMHGKKVLGSPREIQEVRNAFTAYEAMNDWTPSLGDDLLSAHSMLMTGLVNDPGCYRSGGVGIYRGEQLVHMAPPADRVQTLMSNLLGWLATTEVHPLIAGIVFHYELEFIHPFMDGNGRMGRLWQTLILSHWQPVMAYLPVETVIREQQAAYYQALADADEAADATVFVEFILQALNAAMSEVVLAQGSEKSSEKILNLLKVKPQLAAQDIAQILGLSPRAIEKQIAKLKAADRLRRVGPAKGGHWQVLDN